MRRFITLLALSALLVGCGYKLGSTPPVEMLGIKRLHLDLPDNRTQYTRLEAQLANNLSDALVQDGRYRQSALETAGATLETQIKTVEYDQIRSQRTDVLAPEELRMKVTVLWKVVSLDKKQTPLLSGSSTGSTRFFIDDNLQTAQQNAFPDALARVSRQIISELSNAL